MFQRNVAAVCTDPRPPSIQVTPWMNSISRIRGPAFRGIADQALTSAENFAVGVILIRNCTKGEFGLYVLGYGVLILGWSLIAALITAQMAASLSRGPLSEQDRLIKAGSLLRTLLAACIATTGCGYLVTLLLTQLHIVASSDTYYWLLLSSALTGICLRDFMRRYFFQEGSGTQALLMDAFALALTVGALATMAALHARHMNSVAAAILAIGGLAVGSWGVVTSGISPRKYANEPLGGFLSLWRPGRWNIGATLVSWLQNQAYAFFVTAMIGLSGLATANAPRVLLTPIMLLSTGLALPLLPRFAKQSTNLQAIVSFKSVRALFGMTFVFVGIYTIALWLSRDTLMPLVLGGKYLDIWPFIGAWAIVNIFANVRIYYSTFLLAKGSFRRLAVANVFSAVVVIGLTAPLIHFFGAVGSVYAIAAGELILGVASWYQCGIVASAIQADCVAQSA
jgi:O-antigen/teichoic acid export membrane protein